MTLYPRLFEPVRLGNLTVPNRIVRSPHGTGLTGDALIAYHEARARGGVGLSVLEATGVHPGAPSALPLYTDACIPFYERLSTRMAPLGMKVFQQIYHGGAAAPALPGVQFHWSASAIPNPLIGIVPLAMTGAMIDEVTASFAQAARRCWQGGLHGVEVHASSGYLLHEFLSPATNHRTDDYGGTVQNRCRFLLEVLRAIRSEVPDPDFVVGVRLPNDDQVPGGVDPLIAEQVARLVEPEVDYVSLHMGAYWRFHKLIAPADDPLGLEMRVNAPITRHRRKPVIVVGRIMTLDHAHHIVAAGEADMVAMVRSLIADPELVNKARRGEEARIRPCIGSNMGCVGQLMSGRGIGCVVNPAAARETSVSFEPQAPTATPKRLLVVGAGPAGLEFARTAALRGHSVEVHEAMRVAGGQVALAARAPHRADLGAITAWLTAELQRLAVPLHLDSMVDAELVARLAPDEVIIATGTTPRTDGFQVSTPREPVPGHELAHVLNSWDLLGFGNPGRLESPALVFDDTGSFEAISVCDVLLEAGLAVTLVSRFQGIGEMLPYPPVTVGAARERLYEGAFDFIGGHHLRRITPEGVEIGVLFTRRVRFVPARTVVLVGYNEPNRQLVEPLRASGVVTHLIGDVCGRNSMQTAIHAGAELGRRI